MECGYNRAVESLHKNRAEWGLKCRTYLQLSFFCFCPIYDIYGMIKFGIAMETARQQSAGES